MNHRKKWDEHWEKNKASFFGSILEKYRKIIISNCVKHYINRFFPENGVFVETGSGTSQASIKIEKKGRILIAADISKKALEKLLDIKNIDERVNADIFSLPFKDSSIDGIWNLGVMEHFSMKEINMILNEFERVLKPGSFLLLFWPPRHGSSHIALNPVEFFYNLIFRKNFHFFPDEISKLSCKKEARKIIEKSGLDFVDTHFNHRDMFTNYAVICRKS